MQTAAICNSLDSSILQSTIRNEPSSIGDIDEEEVYSASALNNVILPDGRRLSEALSRDPLAPHPDAKPKSRNRVGHYRTGRSILQYYRFRYGDGLGKDDAIENASKSVLALRAKLIEAERTIRCQKEELTRQAKAIQSLGGGLRASVLEAICSRSVTFEQSRLILSGVYLLYSSTGELLYVGQSKNVHARVSHHASTRKFSRVQVLAAKQEDLNDLEGLLIRLLRPPENSIAAAPISKLLDRLIEFDVDTLKGES